LAFPNFILYFLGITQGCVATASLDFRMMNKQILATVIWSNETKTLVCVESLYCTCNHAVFSFAYLVVPEESPTP